MRTCSLVLLLGASLLRAQAGQEGPRREWPCIAGRAVDPAYLETSESTGGQLFLFQKNEISRAGLFLTAGSTHPATVARAVGNLSGSRELEFAIDSTIHSVLIMASVQCLGAIRLFRPGGAEITSGTATQDVQLQSARAVKIDLPEPGRWKLRLEGTGLFIASVHANSTLRLSAITFSDEGSPAPRRQPRFGTQQARIHTSSELENPQVQLMNAAGEVIDGMSPADTPSGDLEFSFTPKIERFRIRITGTDSAGWPVERVDPVLFRAQP